jgi:hypothetical protein
MSHEHRHEQRRDRRRAALDLALSLVAPIVLFYGLRAAGGGIFLALLIGSVPPAVSAAVKLITDRAVDRLAALVLVMLLLSAAVALIGGSPRLLLAKDGWMTGIWALLFFASLWAKRPLTFLFARPLLEGPRASWAKRGSWATSRSWDELWDVDPAFRRVWRVSTVVWGTGLLVDASARVLISYTLPVDVVPGLGGALWPVTFIVLQVLTNIHFARAGMLRTGRRAPVAPDPTRARRSEGG